MKPPRIADWRVIAAIAIATALVCRADAQTRKEEIKPERLEELFKLGLPDAKSAIWAYLNEGGPGGSLSETPFPGLEGGGWLLSETADGTLDLLVDQCHRLRACSERGAQLGARVIGEPEVRCIPADLERDTRTITAILQILSRRPIPPTAEGEFPKEKIDRLDRAAWALLFVAQLWHRGETKKVREILPMIVSVAPSTEALWDYTRARLAEASVDRLGQAWTENGDAAAYADGLERLAVEAPRYWDQRNLVLRLAKAVRAQTDSAKVGSSSRLELADLLLSATPAELECLQGNENWLLPADTIDAALERRILDSSEPKSRTDPVSGSSKPLERPSTPLTAFLSHKREAAAAFVSLLDDHRFVRLMRYRQSNWVSEIGTNTEWVGPSEEAYESAIYKGMSKPIELADFASVRLYPLLPHSMVAESGAAEPKPEVLASWARKIGTMTDEELAWYYLSSDAGFLYLDPSFHYLVCHGSPDSLRKIGELILDHVVAQRHPLAQFDDVLQVYLKRIGGEAPGFRERLYSVAAKAGYVREPCNSVFGLVLSPDRVLKMIDRIASGEEAAHREQGPIFEPVEWMQVEGKLYDAAAKANNQRTREKLVQLGVECGLYSYTATWRNLPPPAAATRSAIQRLLQDQSPLSLEVGRMHFPGLTIADLTAKGFADRRGTDDERSRWSEINALSPALGDALLRDRAEALAADRPAPPLPVPDNVSDSQLTELIERLNGLPPPEIVRAYWLESRDRQAALTRWLARKEEWLPSLLAAHLSVSRIDVKGDIKDFGRLERWKGRRMNAELRQEIESALADEAKDGHALTISVYSPGPLAGLILQVRANDHARSPLPKYQSRDFGAGPRPIGLMRAEFQDEFVIQSQFGHRWVHYSSPVWADSSSNERWRKAHLQEEVVLVEKLDSPNTDYNPLDFERACQKIFDGKPGVARPFCFTWRAELFDSEAVTESGK